MELSSFARIGKGVLSKAIGLQKNYKETYAKGPDRLNERKSGCFSCDTCRRKDMLRALGRDADADVLGIQCKNCPSAVWEPSYTTGIRYINERNRFGYQPTLKGNAIKLLLLYHFLQPDALGFVRNVDVRFLAGVIGCTQATVSSCNEVLQSYGYCCSCDSGLKKHHINIYLPEYRNYHKTASEGGRGYLTLSSELFFDLVKIHGLNTLRLNLKGILEVDNASYSDTHNSTLSPVNTPYGKLRGFLPRYCKNNVIRRALEDDGRIFQVTFLETSVTFSIRGKYAQKTLREDMKEDFKETLAGFTGQVNEILETARTALLPDEKERLDKFLLAMGIHPSEHCPPLALEGPDYEDLATLALQYSLPLVLWAITTIYNHYILNGKPVERAGALARVIIRNRSVFETAA